MLKPFNGMTNQSLDVKNRISIPSKFRFGEYRDAEQIYMLIVFSKFPHIDFFFDEEAVEEEIERRKSKLSPNTPPEVIDLMFNGCLDTLALDKQGRTSAINSRYLHDAKLNRDMVIIGNGNYFSAYDSFVYEDFMKQSSEVSVLRYDAMISATKKDYERLAAGGGLQSDEKAVSSAEENEQP